MSCGQKTRYDIERGNFNVSDSQYKTSYINEGYNYIRNQPKNVNAIILNRNPNIENYGYDVAYLLCQRFLRRKLHRKFYTPSRRFLR